MQCGEVWDEGGGGRGTKPEQPARVPVSETARAFATPGCQGPVARPLPPTWCQQRKSVGGRLASTVAGRQADRCTGEELHVLGFRGVEKALEAPSGSLLCLMPYFPECARSLLLSEPKQFWASLVLGWEPLREQSVL